MGIIMFSLLCGQFPFDINNQEDQERLLNGEVSFESYNDANLKFDRFENVTEDAKDLIASMLEKDPDDRISVEDALQHQWFKIINLSFSSEERCHFEVGSTDGDLKLYG